MKQFFQFFVITCVLFASVQTIAQQHLQTNIQSVQLRNHTVSFTIHGSRPFYVGGNLYVLYVGDNVYKHSTQKTSKDKKGTITFIIPEKDFEAVKSGDPIYLSYGEVHLQEGENMQSYLEDHTSTCRDLGVYNNTMLTK